MATFEKVSPGSPKGKSPALKSAWLNAVSEASAHYHSQVAGGQPGSGPSYLRLPTDLVRVRNLTSGDRLRGHVVQLGNYLLDELDFRNLWFEGNLVASPVERRIAVLRSAVKEGEIGVAQMSGVCTAWVYVNDVDDTHAAPTAGDHIFESGTSGQVEILSPLEETGEQEVAVLLRLGCP